MIFLVCVQLVDKWYMMGYLYYRDETLARVELRSYRTDAGTLTGGILE